MQYYIALNILPSGYKISGRLINLFIALKDKALLYYY